MLIYESKDLARAFRTVRQNTIQIAEEIPEDKYGFRPAEGCRSVAETLAHVAVATRWPQRAHTERVSELTLQIFQTVLPQMQQEEASLRTKADILAALRKGGDEFATFLEALPEAVLIEKVTFPPETQQPPKTRFEMLLSTKEHEMHHRGQLMVVERMLGVVPHLTRQMQERMAAMQQMQKQASAHGA
ncbi:MAG TPA: DinB family protein [Bryobacteraceae bacterium]|nr:DinB family protein [Bryobacteraceae bacterium]